MSRASRIDLVDCKCKCTLVFSSISFLYLGKRANCQVFGWFAVSNIQGSVLKADVLKYLFMLLFIHLMFLMCAKINVEEINIELSHSEQFRSTI